MFPFVVDLKVVNLEFFLPGQHRHFLLQKGVLSCSFCPQIGEPVSSLLLSLALSLFLASPDSVLFKLLLIFYPLDLIVFRLDSVSPFSVVSLSFITLSFDPCDFRL